MTTSERALTLINNSIFFKEFTYSKNEVYRLDGGSVELADNVVWLDDLLLVYQIKERVHIKKSDTITENRWFRKTVNGQARKQINDTLKYFKTYRSLPVVNERGQKIDVSSARNNEILKLIIYDPNSELLEVNRRMKFLKGFGTDLIHLFEIKDYQMVCKYLVTPSELADYLNFREQLYRLHSSKLKFLSEEYVLGHFFTTLDTTSLNEDYESNLNRLENDKHSYDVSWMLDNFFEKLIMFDKGRPTDYHYIVKEIAKLNREELKGFNERYYTTLNNVKTETFSLPMRFVSPRTRCGFVFITLLPDKIALWENALVNMTEIYKYKHRLEKCLGVVMFRNPPYYDVFWTFSLGPWQYDEQLAQMVADEEEFYGGSQVQVLPRYQFIY
ncbi:hypothetical protein [Pedobacter sp. GR22-10]|uniref:hypothetical protein n=1 Tax=Pedobacter sp. GR22-10 TaxID=2994472 RepID=UPI0022484430|nr:hypothetical protein [Pedobacter sp. GR22-10]MCX2430542.1 hypothetical protein [Pedobacter sp. GR22-10]